MSQCLIGILLAAHALPLHTNQAADNEDNGTLSSSALSRARMQAFPPATSQRQLNDNPWNAASPKRVFNLSLGFAL